MTKVIIVSADGHCGALAPMYRPYLEKRYWPALDELAKSDEVWSQGPAFREFNAETLEVVDERSAIRSGGRGTGGWDFGRRLKEMDAEGIAGEVVGFNNPWSSSLWFGAESQSCFPPELRDAGVHAFHRWLADQMADTDSRILGSADPGSCLDMDTTLRELRWVAEHGFVAMNPPGVTQDPANPVPPLWDMYYEPFWAACEDLGLRLFVHAAYGIRLGSFLEGDLALAPGAERFKSDREDSLTQALREAEAENIRGIMVGPRRVFWELLLGRVFDRHPNLKLAFTEIRSTWVPGWLAYLDQRFEQENIPLKHRPSEYFRTQCMVTPSNPRTSEVAMRHSIGANQLMFGADFPHLESTWPNTLEWIQATFGYAAVPEDEARAILGENAIKFYGFDRAKLAAVAERIGAQASELLVPGRVVDPRKIASFDERSGFNKPMGDPLEGTQAMLDDALRQFAAGEMSRAN